MFVVCGVWRVLPLLFAETGSYSAAVPVVSGFTNDAVSNMQCSVNEASTSICMVAGFHEDTASNTFGRLTKDGKYKAYADFRFEFTAKVACVMVLQYISTFSSICAGE